MQARLSFSQGKLFSQDALALRCEIDIGEQKRANHCQAIRRVRHESARSLLNGIDISVQREGGRPKHSMVARITSTAENERCTCAFVKGATGAFRPGQVSSRS